MLLFDLPLLLSDPGVFFILMGLTSVSLLSAITVHEFSHALIAYRLGDTTAARLGRLSLNPLVHLDIVGTLMLLLVGFGWGKPVPVSPYGFRNIKRDMALVSFAGPCSNILLAGLLALPIRLGLTSGGSPFALGHSPGLWGWLGDLLGFLIFYNIILAVFNLLPIPPLDGFKVALGLLPLGIANSLARVERFGPGILMLIIGFGYFTGYSILWAVLGPVMDWVSRLLVGQGLF